jgi:hypothetical protein
MKKLLSYAGLGTLGLLALVLVAGRVIISGWIFFVKIPAASGEEYAIWWVALLVSMFAGGK